jgi:preprotein translocase SecE subunit
MSQDKVSDERSAPPSSKVRNAISYLERCRRYVKDVRSEMRQVSWPNWKQVCSTTVVVLFFTFAMAAFLKLVDVVAAFLYRLVVGR